jgi:hypothetical protein
MNHPHRCVRGNHEGREACRVVLDNNFRVVRNLKTVPGKQAEMTGSLALYTRDNGLSNLRPNGNDLRRVNPHDVLCPSVHSNQSRSVISADGVVLISLDVRDIHHADLGRDLSTQSLFVVRIR